MATLARQVTSAATTHLYSAYRDLQLRTQLEAYIEALRPCGIVSGGRVTTAGSASPQVTLASGSEFATEGVVYTLSGSQNYVITNLAGPTVYLWGLVTRTAGGALNPTTEDSYALVVSETLVNTPPTALHIPLAVCAMNGAGIDSLTYPTNRWARPATVHLFDRGRPATGHIRFAANANNGDTVTVTDPVGAKIYGFGAGGDVTVTIGGSAAATALNLATAILANQAGRVAAARHGTDTTVVDVSGGLPGDALTLAESTAGARIIVQDNGEELAAAAVFPFWHTRTITAEDVLRTRIRVATGGSTVRSVQAQIRVSAASRFSIGWDGVLTITGGVIELDNSGAQDWAAANVLEIEALVAE